MSDDDPLFKLFIENLHGLGEQIGRLQDSMLTKDDFYRTMSRHEERLKHIETTQQEHDLRLTVNDRFVSSAIAARTWLVRYSIGALLVALLGLGTWTIEHQAIQPQPTIGSHR